MSVLTILIPVVVALVGLVGVGLTAFAGLRANTLRVAAEAEAKERTEEAARRQAETDALRSERDRINAYHERLHEAHLAEITRLASENADLRARLREVRS